jgi:hypothetical protein
VFLRRVWGERSELLFRPVHYVRLRSRPMSGFALLVTVRDVLAAHAAAAVLSDTAFSPLALRP